jgi:hypothetical protein
MIFKKINNVEEIRHFLIEVLDIDVLDDTKSRRREIVEARSLFYRIAFDTNANLTLQTVGDLFGKTHSSIIHGLNNYDDWLYRELDVHRNTFIATYNADLTFKDTRQSLLIDITSKVLKIDDSEELEIFTEKLKQLL